MALNKRKVLDTARKHAQKGAKAKALKEYNKLLKVDPHDAKLLLEVGDAYRRWGQPEEAIAQYSKVAGQYRQDGFDARAVAVFKQILNLDPKHYSAYVALGELYQRMGLDSEAVASLQIAADGYHKEGRKPEALDLLRQMAALDPSNTTSRLKVAELLRQEGMEEEAIVEYQAVAQELQNQQERDQLIVVQERILEIRPNQLDTLCAQVRCLMGAGQLDRAEPIAVRALNVANEPEQYELLIDLYAQMGHDAKLADATRGLAKIYRDRGDEDKARELMQRLPSEDFGAPDSGLAVDLSEAEEPMLDDEELLDQPFLAMDDDFETIASKSASMDPGLTGNSLSGSAAKIELEDISLDASDEIGADVSVSAVPEGDPDQLLAEASVYLRYGKREQAIASLKGVIAQDANHRGALEKLGEAYAEDGQNSEAVQTWLQAAEQIRLAGDAESLDILRDRVAALDPGLAAQIGSVEAAPDSPPDASLPEIGLDVTETDSLGMELDLDVEVDLNLDDAIEEVAASETNAGYEFEPPGADDEFEIDLDEDSEIREDTSSTPVPESPDLDVETSADEGVSFELDADLEYDTDEFITDTSDDDSGFVDLAESAEIAAEFDPDTSAELSLDEDDDDDSAIEFEIDADDLTDDEFISDADDPSDDVGDEIAAAGSAGIDDEELPESGGSLSTNFDEEIEEAEFYVAQDMYDEAEAIIGRVLEGAPNHPRALLMKGEILAARGGAAEASVSAPTGDIAADVEVTEPAIEVDLATADDAEVSFEVELGEDAEVEADEPLTDNVPESVTAASEEASIEREAEVVEAEVEIEEPVETEPLAAKEAEVVEEASVVDAAIDPDDSFDLREALADVFEEDPAETSSGVSGVESTVDDGFESIFSDFKKGVSATLGDGDYDTRHDLGIAYREMGLFDDAIAEFRVCLDSPARRFNSLYLMGLCARDLTRWEDSVNHLEQALALPEIPEERLAGVYFDLSISQEGSGDAVRALASVQRVLELDSEFPGAAERLALLQSGESALPEVGNPGERYESFDELFEGDEDDEGGDEEIAEAVPVETFESFDDVLSDAEAAFDEEDAANETTDPGDSKKSGRKKISFV